MNEIYYDECVPFSEEEFQRISECLRAAREHHASLMRRDIGHLYSDVHRAFPRFFQPMTAPFVIDLGKESE